MSDDSYIAVKRPPSQHRQKLPDDIAPIGEVGYCVQIPDDNQWRGAFLAAVHSLTHYIKWEKTEDRGALVVRDRWLRSTYFPLVNTMLADDRCGEDEGIKNGVCDSEGCNFMGCCGASTVFDTSDNPYFLRGDTIIPYGQEKAVGVKTAKQNVIPTAEKQGYSVNPTDFQGDQIGGVSPALQLTSCGIATAFVPYLLAEVETFIDTLVNAQQAATAAPDFLASIIDDVPILGSITRALYEGVANFPLDVLLDARVLLDDPQYLYRCQRVMYGMMIEKDDLVVTRGMLTTWANNTPILWGATLTPMRAILLVAVQSIDYGFAQRQADILRNDGDPELCASFGIDPSPYPALGIGNETVGAIDGYWLSQPVRFTLNDDNFSGTPSENQGVVYAENVPAGGIAGWLIKVVNWEHVGVLANFSTVRFNLRNFLDEELTTSQFNLSSVGGSATVEDDGVTPTVIIVGTDFLASSVQSVNDFYTNAVEMEDNTAAISIDAKGAQSVHLWADLQSWNFGGSDQLSGVIDVQIVFDNAVYPQP